MSVESEYFLEHFGKKGMKWGVRKNRSLQGKADKLKNYADRRPTRGNIRTAERAQKAADRKFNKRKLTNNEKKILAATVTAAAALGASYIAGKISGGKGKVKISDMNKGAGKLVRDIGSNYANGILKSNDASSLSVIKNTARQIEDGYRSIL